MSNLKAEGLRQIEMARDVDSCAEMLDQIDRLQDKLELESLDLCRAASARRKAERKSSGDFTLVGVSPATDTKETCLYFKISGYDYDDSVTYTLSELQEPLEVLTKRLQATARQRKRRELTESIALYQKELKDLES